MDALICLEKNVDSLSPGCKTAVEAVEPASSPAPETTAQPSESASAPAAESSGGSEANAADASVASAEDSSAGASAPTTSAATPPAAHPKLTFRQEMAVAGGSCAVDFRLFCPNLPVGHGNVLFCLQVHWHRLAPPCRDALTKLGAAPGS